jgi:hypothetical protein
MRPGVRPCTASAGPPGSAAVASSAPPASIARRLATAASSAAASRPEEAAARTTAQRRLAARGGGAREAVEVEEVVVEAEADGPRPHAERSTPAAMFVALVECLCCRRRAGVCAQRSASVSA